MTNIHILTPTVKTTTGRFACLKCGAIGKSGKSSCCGRGGSWFRNCGSAGSTKLRHTWYEGISACKLRVQFKTVRPRQPNSAQELNSSYGIGMGNSITVITAGKNFTFTSAITPTTMPTAYASTTSTTSIITHTVKAETVTKNWIYQGMCRACGVSRYKSMLKYAFCIHAHSSNTLTLSFTHAHTRRTQI